MGISRDSERIALNNVAWKEGTGSLQLKKIIIIAGVSERITLHNVSQTRGKVLTTKNKR